MSTRGRPGARTGLMSDRGRAANQVNPQLGQYKGQVSCHSWRFRVFFICPPRSP